MSEMDYTERGSSTINTDLNQATIAFANDPVKRKANLEVTTNGHLRGFIQPATATERLEAGSMRKKLLSGTYNSTNSPDYAKLMYLEVPNADGELVERAHWVYEDIVMPSGQPLTKPAGYQSIILFTQKLREMEKDNKPLPTGDEKEEAAIHGYVNKLDGSLYTPANWRRSNKETGEIFYGGDCQEFDRDMYLDNKRDNQDSEHTNDLG